MTPEEFRTLSGPETDRGMSSALKALWHDARGSWDEAHATVQDNDGPEAAWVHAYLHRKDGDENNAEYWYRRAGRKKSSESSDGEWHDIVSTLLQST